MVKFILKRKDQFKNIKYIVDKVLKYFRNIVSRYFGCEKEEKTNTLYNLVINCVVVALN